MINTTEDARYYWTIDNAFDPRKKQYCVEKIDPNTFEVVYRARNGQMRHGLINLPRFQTVNEALAVARMMEEE